MLCKKLHHAAFRCKDARETVEFYTKVLGLKFAHAMGEDHVPSTGKYSPHVHVFLEMEDGSSIAFFECPNDPGHVKDMESPDWIQHFAFEVESLDALLKAKADMEAKGVACSPIHEERWGSLTQVTLPGGGKLGVYQPKHGRPPKAGSSPQKAKRKNKRPTGSR